MSKKRQQQLLLSLLVLVLAVLAWRRLAPALADGVGVRQSDQRQRITDVEVERGSDSLPVVEELRLEELEAASGALKSGRNPFQVEEKPSPPPAPSAAELRAALEKERQKKPVPAVRSEPPKPTPPPVDVVFLGSFGPSRHRLAVFSDGREIYNVPEGKVLKDKFVVVRIGFESADLGFVDFPSAPTRRLEIGG